MRYNDNMLGGDKPRCKPNGEFEPIQCNGSLCYCVDRNGKSLLGTYVPLCETPVCPGKHTGTSVGQWCHHCLNINKEGRKEIFFI